MRLYVGNLPFRVTEDELRDLYSPFGKVVYAMISTDRETGRPRGFGFVEFANREDGERAIRETNGALLDGRPVKVNEAEAKEARDGRFGGAGGYWKR